MLYMCDPPTHTFSLCCIEASKEKTFQRQDKDLPLETELVVYVDSSHERLVVFEHPWTHNFCLDAILTTSYPLERCTPADTEQVHWLVVPPR